MCARARVCVRACVSVSVSLCVCTRACVCMCGYVCMRTCVSVCVSDPKDFRQLKKNSNAPIYHTKGFISVIVAEKIDCATDVDDVSCNVILISSV